jgi:hypothetical protein
MVRGRPPSLPQARIRLRKPFSPHLRRRASTLLRANDIAAALVRIMATRVTLRQVSCEASTEAFSLRREQINRQQSDSEKA